MHRARPTRLAPREARRTRRAGLRRADPMRECLRSLQRSEGREHASVLGESFTHRLAPMRPPIPLEGGFERAPEHNARGLCVLGLPAE